MKTLLVLILCLLCGQTLAAEKTSTEYAVGEYVATSEFRDMFVMLMSGRDKCLKSKGEYFYAVMIKDVVKDHGCFRTYLSDIG